MTLSDIATKIRTLTNTDTNNYPNANLLIDLNLWYQKAASMIIESMDEGDFNDQRSSTDPFKDITLVANTRDYALAVSDKILKIKRLDITYDGVNWYRAHPIDSGEIEFPLTPSTATTAEVNLDNKFSKSDPRYDYKYNKLWIYPRPSTADVAAGGTMRLEFIKQITEFTLSDLTTGTAIPGFDDPFHPILCYGPAFEYAASKQWDIAPAYQQQLQDYEARLKQHYSNKLRDRSYRLSPEYVDYK